MYSCTIIFCLVTSVFSSILKFVSHCFKNEYRFIAVQTTVKSYFWTSILRFQLPVVNCGLKMSHEKFQKQTNLKF